MSGCNCCKFATFLYCAVADDSSEFQHGWMICCIVHMSGVSLHCEWTCVFSEKSNVSKIVYFYYYGDMVTTCMFRLGHVPLFYKVDYANKLSAPKEENKKRKQEHNVSYRWSPLQNRFKECCFRVFFFFWLCHRHCKSWETFCQWASMRHLVFLFSPKFHSQRCSLLLAMISDFRGQYFRYKI